MPHSLSSLAFAVMAVVGRDGASGPELVQMAAGGAPFFWTGAGSHVLRTARRLADDGYLRTRTEPATTRPRTIYELTPQRPSQIWRASATSARVMPSGAQGANT
jgi:DNA-binding PadR family transcriptional regulator